MNFLPNNISYTGNGKSNRNHKKMQFLLQARRQWVEQQAAFQRQRREHEAKMVAMEEAEVQRREEEVRPSP